MSKTTKYLFHEMSSYLPLLEGDEFNDLVEDIKEHGQIELVTLYKGKILDGRNRYRACKMLNIELITREWKPSKATGSTPLQYVISENIMRRHLNIAQKAEIGMLLYDEVEKQVQEEQRKKQSETQKGIPKKELGVNKVTLPSKEKDPTRRTAYKVAQKVRVKPHTIQKVKIIKEIAKEDKEIAEEWEKAKKGDSSITAVYQEASKIKAIAKLPEDLQVVIKKEEVKVKEAKKKEITYEPVITIKEAKVIAEIPNEALRKKEIAEREMAKKRRVKAIQDKKDLAEGKQKIPDKFFNKDANKIEAVKNICKKAMSDLTFAGLEGYGDFARKECIKMMKILFEHLRKELKEAGEVAPRKVIDVD